MTTTTSYNLEQEWTAIAVGVPRVAIQSFMVMGVRIHVGQEPPSSDSDDYIHLVGRASWLSLTELGDDDVVFARAHGDAPCRIVVIVGE